MHLYVESLLLALFGTVPALVILVVFFHQKGHSFEGFSCLVVVAVLCACVSILVARCRLLGSKAAEAQTQTDDAEVGRDGSAPEDAPPVYDAVVSKPPSYEFVCGNPPDLSCWEDDAEAGVPMRDACTDCDLPTYAQVTQAPSPV